MLFSFYVYVLKIPDSVLFLCTEQEKSYPNYSNERLNDAGF